MADNDVAIINAKTPFEGVLTGGQPSGDQLQAARDAGYRTIVNLRPDAELGGWDEAQAVQNLGMRYVHIPIASGADLSEEAARKLAAAIEETPVMVHCGSGNRVGALFAVKARLIDGEDTETAVATGKRAGLTGAEADVRRLLG